MLRTLLVQGAHYIIGPFGKDSDLRRFGLSLVKRGGQTAKKKAVVAVDTVSPANRPVRTTANSASAPSEAGPKMAAPGWTDPNLQRAQRVAQQDCEWKRGGRAGGAFVDGNRPRPRTRRDLRLCTERGPSHGS